MRFRFTGIYTGGRNTINAGGVTFEGREPLEVTDPDMIRRLSNHIEFEAIHPLDHDGEPGGSLPDAARPRKRGRSRKVALDG